MRRRLLKSLLLICLFCATARAQGDLCTVSGTATDVGGTVAPKGLQFTITPISAPGHLVITTPLRPTVGDAGFISFQVFKGARVRISAPLPGYATPGREVQIPDLDTYDFGALINLPLAPLTFSNPMTTAGDMMGATTGGAPVRVAGNTSTTKKWLSQTGTGSQAGQPVWAQPGVNDINGLYSNNPQDGQRLVYNAAHGRYENTTVMGSDVAWGSITGTLSDQSDLAASLAAKANSGHTHNESDVTGLTSDLASKANASHTHTLSQVTDAGTAASKNAPASGNAALGEVVLGNDSRLTDARSPIPHASFHAAAGSDPLTLSQSQISGLAAALAGKQDALGFTAENSANKGAASGYAPLNSSSLVPPANLGSGTRDGSKFLRDDGTWQTVNAGVTSFNTRIGAVVPAANDYNFNQLAGSLAIGQIADGLITNAKLASGIVNSFNGRSGAVSPATNDYSFSQISGSVADGQLSSNVFYVDGTRAGSSAATTGNAFSFDGLSLTSGGLFKARVHNAGFTGSLVKITDDAGTPATLFQVDNTGAIVTGSIPYASVTSKAVVNADVASNAAIAYSKLNLSSAIVNADIASGAAIANSKLANSSLTVGSTSVSLGGTAATIAGLTLTQPTVADFTNAAHNHQNAAGGGQLAEAALALTDITINNASASRHGFLPKLSGNASDVLKGDGTFGAVSGGVTSVSGTSPIVSSGGTTPAISFDFSVANNFTAAQTVTRAPAANTSIDGLILADTTAASSGNQQYSPRLHWTGQGWKTNSTAASQTVDWIAELQPVQGAANPTSKLIFASQINGAGYSTRLSLSSDGSSTFGGLQTFDYGSFGQVATVGFSGFNFRIFSNSNNNDYQLFADGSAPISFYASQGAASGVSWQISASKHFLAGTDNSFDIGAAAASRPRTGYFGTSVVAPKLNFSTTVTPSGSGDAQGSTGDVRYDDSFIYVKTASGGWKRAALSTF